MKCIQIITLIAILNLTGVAFGAEPPEKKVKIAGAEEIAEAGACPICLVKVPSLTLPCNHKFCQDCVLQKYESDSQNPDRVAQRTSCSLCRRNHDIFITVLP